jgi:hypothetical protein
MGHRSFCDSRFRRRAWLSSASAQEVGCVLFVYRVAYLGMAGSTIDFGPFEVSMIILMPLVVAAFLIWYSKQAENKGWIS